MKTKEKASIYTQFVIMFMVGCAIVLGFWYTASKSMDNRCDYYRTLPNFSSDIKLQQTCP